MEQAGFARYQVAGEYYPTVAWAYATADVSTTAVDPTFADWQSVYLTTETVADQINVLINGTVSDSVVSGNTPRMRISVDGASQGGIWQTISIGNGGTNFYRCKTITGLQPGVHKVTLQWSDNQAGTLRARAATVPNAEFLSLIAWRTKAFPADRERDGYVWNGWASHYSTGATYAAISASTTNIGSSPTTSLLKATVQTYRQPGSALLIRFGASGTVNTATANARFRILVDGVVQGGTAQGADGANRFNAKMMTVAAVGIGVHTVEVQWAGGGTSGSTIDPVTNVNDFAEVQIEEVFCPDVGNLIQDAGGYPVSGFASHNVPQVRFAKLTSDIAGLNANQLLGRIDMYVTGDNSFAQIEGSCGSDVWTAGDTQNLRVWVDDYSGVKFGGNIATGALVMSGANVTQEGTSSNYISRVIQLQQGWHRIELAALFAQAGSKIQPVTSPNTMHASLLVREIAAYPIVYGAANNVGSQY